MFFFSGSDPENAQKAAYCWRDAHLYLAPLNNLIINIAKKIIEYSENCIARFQAYFLSRYFDIQERN